MARKNKYQVDEVLRYFTKRKGVKIREKVVEVDKRNDLGNRSWGRLDFLRNHNGYVVMIKSK